MIEKKYTAIFGPIPSRRFGLSLGVDLSPGKKQCNYDCLYCELAAAKAVEKIENPPPVNLVIEELKEALKEHPDAEVITITANGEPTLYPFLDELIERIDKIKGSRKSLILSNASTIYDQNIQKALLPLDMVKLSLDCATPECFKKLDRPVEGIDLRRVVDGISSFRKLYTKELILEILMVPGINTTDEEIEALNRVLASLKADRIDIGTVDRPPAYPVEPISYKELHEISQKFDHSLPIHITKRSDSKVKKSSYSYEEITETLRKRPLTIEDIEALMDKASIERFKKLLESGKIKTAKLGGIEFYGTGFSKQKRKKS